VSLLGATGLARRAVQHKMITSSTAERWKGIAVLRNLSAHGRASELTEDRALDYLALVDGVLFAIRRDAKEAQGR
jgi:hypothetical protein